MFIGSNVIELVVVEFTSGLIFVGSNVIELVGLILVAPVFLGVDVFPFLSVILCVFSPT
jgi:hypothetical protein